jgi:CRP-like cAMP-binding protein
VLDAIVARAMAKGLAERYPNWEEFAQDLAQAVRTRQLKIPQPDFADTEKFAALRGMPFFAAFSDAEIWETLRFSTWARVMPGTSIMRDGEPGDSFCFLANGELKVSKGGKLLNLLTNGDCFGEMAIINSRQSPLRGADVIALTQADIITVRGEALQQATAACRMLFYQGFLEVLATRLAFANQRMAAF